MARFTPPYLGAAYYPEDWPPEQVDEDIALMKDAGATIMRVGEFAWSSMEPREGHYDFDWLHRVVDKLGEAGIATIMCTPTCTPPAWLAEAYPEVLVMDAKGLRSQHGSRRHFCPNSPVYRAHCERINQRLAAEFGRDENVVGWQIDNEVHPFGPSYGCHCPVCLRKFQDMLRERFGAIENLNAAWGTDLWSQTYNSFAQIPVVREDTWHHPSLLTAWDEFQSQSFAEYVSVQAGTLREHTSQPIGTDMMPTLAVGYEPMHRNLDLVQYNHYDQMDGLWQQVFWMDLIRPVKEAPFWNTETATCWNGSTTANGYKPAGFCRANSWLPIALGGEANLYWLWRAHWSGQELMHGSVVSSCGRPLHMIDEVREIAAGFKASAAFLNGTRPVGSGLGVHFSSHAWSLFRHQPMVNGFRYKEDMLERFYRPLMEGQLRADVLDPAAGLDGYKLVCSPFLPALDEGGLRERLHAWIQAGGTWVVGPLADNRTLNAAKFKRSPFGSIEEWAGVYCKYQIPGDPESFAMRWGDGPGCQGSIWYDGFEITGQGQALATYAEGPLKGLAAVVETPLGKGRIIVLGTMPEPAFVQKLLLTQAAQAGVTAPAQATSNLLVVPREGAAGRGLIIVELENKPATLELPRAATDLLSDAEHSGTVEVSPCGVMVLAFR